MDLFELLEVNTRPHSFKQNSAHKQAPRRYKTYRQLVADEVKFLATKNNIKFDTPTYTSVAAPPSLVPKKHYCDITGLEGRYKSPANSLRFHNVEIYRDVIRTLPSGVDQEYLQLRGANVILK